MKKTKLLSILSGSLLVWLLCYGSLSCLISGVGLTVDPGLGLQCAGLALIFCLCFQLRRGWIGLIPVLGLYLLYFHRADVWENGYHLFLSLGQLYDRAYGFGIFGNREPQFLGENMTRILGAIALVQSLICSLVLGKRRSLCWTLPFLLLPVGLTLVVIDTVPSEGSIFLLLLGLLLAIFTHSTRRRDLHQGAVLTLQMAVPMLLAVSLLLNSIPRGSYVAPSLDAIEKGILSFLFERPQPTIQGTLPYVPTVPPTTQVAGLSGGKVDLSRVGPKRELFTPVMQVWATYSGNLYLRSRSYTYYNGLGWNNMFQDMDPLLRIEQGYVQYLPDARVTIQTRYPQQALFLPYYSQLEQKLTDGGVANQDKLSTYQYSPQLLLPDWQTRWLSLHSGLTVADAADYTHNIAMPDFSREALQPYLDEIGITAQTPLLDAVEMIQTYVQQSAAYSLDTQRMPAGYEDFAGWFLSESDTGYCVHFATAAAALLRAAGIPARYAEGYTVNISPIQAQGNALVTVNESMAHAWVEYYVPGAGWLVMDPTPGRDEPPIPPDTQPSNPTTTPGTDPTVPSVPTQGTTVPGTSQGTVPTTTPEKPRFQLPAIPREFWIGFGCLAAFVCLAVLQWQLRLRWRLRRLRRGGPNQQALTCWRYSCRLAKVIGQPPHEELQVLARKAKFSQHQLSEAELHRFYQYFDLVTERLQKKPWPLRLLYRLVLAIY